MTPPSPSASIGAASLAGPVLDRPGIPAGAVPPRLCRGDRRRLRRGRVAGLRLDAPARPSRLGPRDRSRDLRPRGDPRASRGATGQLRDAFGRPPAGRCPGPGAAGGPLFHRPEPRHARGRGPRPAGDHAFSRGEAGGRAGPADALSPGRVRLPGHVRGRPERAGHPVGGGGPPSGSPGPPPRSVARPHPAGRGPLRAVARGAPCRSGLVLPDRPRAGRADARGAGQRPGSRTGRTPRPPARPDGPLLRRPPRRGRRAVGPGLRRRGQVRRPPRRTRPRATDPGRRAAPQGHTPGRTPAHHLAGHPPAQAPDPLGDRGPGRLPGRADRSGLRPVGRRPRSGRLPPLRPTHVRPGNPPPGRPGLPGLRGHRPPPDRPEAEPMRWIAKSGRRKQMVVDPRDAGPTQWTASGPDSITIGAGARAAGVEVWARLDPIERETRRWMERAEATDAGS